MKVIRRRSGDHRRKEKVSEKDMKKILKIEGMSCAHCQGRVEKALNSLDGVTAKVDLKKAQAIVRLGAPVDDAVLTAAVAAAGYTVTSIQESRGIFG